MSQKTRNFVKQELQKFIGAGNDIDKEYNHNQVIEFATALLDRRERKSINTDTKFPKFGPSI